MRYSRYPVSSTDLARMAGRPASLWMRSEASSVAMQSTEGFDSWKPVLLG